MHSNNFPSFRGSEGREAARDATPLSSWLTEGGEFQFATNTPASGQSDMPHESIPKRQRSNARAMRRAMTDSELKFWNAVRAHRLMGLKFRRQLPIGNYIVDFALPEYRLIVEIDGSQHAAESNRNKELNRTAFLESQGWHVLRFWNHEVLSDIDGVCDPILRYLTSIGVVFADSDQ